MTVPHNVSVLFFYPNIPQCYWATNTNLHCYKPHHETNNTNLPHTMRAQQYNFYYYSMCNFLCCKNKPFLLSMMTTSIYLYTYIQHKLFASPHENVIYNWHKMSIIQHLVTHYVSPPLLFPHLTKCKFTTITLYHKPSKMGKTQAVIPTPHQWYFHHWCCGPAHSAWTNIIHASFFDNHCSAWDNLFFFFSWPHKLSDPYLQNVGHISL